MTGVVYFIKWFLCILFCVISLLQLVGIRLEIKGMGKGSDVDFHGGLCCLTQWWLLFDVLRCSVLHATILSTG
jgi:cbb3-type cytochrome oxidase subunit 1